MGWSEWMNREAKSLVRKGGLKTDVPHNTSHWGQVEIKKTSLGERWQAGLSSQDLLWDVTVGLGQPEHRGEREMLLLGRTRAFEELARGSQSIKKHFQRKSNIRQACPFCFSGLWRDKGCRMRKKRKVLCWCILFPADYPTSCLCGQPIQARMLWCWL